MNKGEQMKIIIIAVLLTVSSLVQAETTDDTDSISNKIYILDSIHVTDSRVHLGLSEFPASKDAFTKILKLNRFSLIRKGTFIAQDVYNEGFKRGDVAVVIDGEQYHSACPNRMDSPLTRVNPLEMNLISFQKENATLSTGLGGGLSITRIKPSTFSNIKTSYTQSAAAESGSDLALIATRPNLLLTGRYATGYGYEDGDKNNFETLYNFSDDYTYQLAEFSAIHKTGDISYRGAFTYTDNVMFPYLQMDERLNRVYSGYMELKKNKIYFNYTSHLMDNQLRVSNMLMRTEAKNLTIGFINNNLEILYRNWDSDNIIKTAMTTIENHLIPNVDYYSAVYQSKLDKNALQFSYKAGIKYVAMQDENRLAMFSTLYPDADNSNYYFTGGATGSYETKLSQKSALKFSTEISTSEPSLEQLYISVKKPMMNPTWLGNPSLNQPFKYSLRTTFSTSHINVSVYSHYISDFITFTKQISGTQKYSTYTNIDAWITGFNFNYNLKNLTISSGYTYAQNKSNDNPLSEIPPFFLMTSVKSPKYKNSVLILSHTYNDAQTRVDNMLTESKTSAWHRVDLSLTYFNTSYQVSLGLENLFDETYQQHLSYLRDPFSSGLAVNEPGRTIRLSLLYDYNL